jgi:hypothetical protein
LSFYADDSLGLDEAQADTDYGDHVDELAAALNSLGATATIAHLRHPSGRLVVWPADQLDDPRVPKESI